jgi:hypothetical protein
VQGVDRRALWLLLPFVGAAAAFAALAWWVPLAFLFSAPWLAAIVWVCVRAPDDSGEVEPGYAELARRRLRSS